MSELPNLASRGSLCPVGAVWLKATARARAKLLIDGNTIRKIVAAAALEPGWRGGDGPGAGAITLAMARLQARLLATLSWTGAWPMLSDLLRPFPGYGAAGRCIKHRLACAVKA